MSVKEVILGLNEKINADPFAIEGMNTVYQFDLNGAEEISYQIKIANDQVEFFEDCILEPNCTILMSSSDFLKLASGELNGQMAFLMGQLRMKGDITLGIQLNSIMQSYR